MARDKLCATRVNEGREKGSGGSRTAFLLLPDVEIQLMVGTVGMAVSGHGERVRVVSPPQSVIT